jgi:hypothetical protein
LDRKAEIDAADQVHIPHPHASIARRCGAGQPASRFLTFRDFRSSSICSVSPCFSCFLLLSSLPLSMSVLSPVSPHASLRSCLAPTQSRASRPLRPFLSYRSHTASRRPGPEGRLPNEGGAQRQVPAAEPMPADWRLRLGLGCGRGPQRDRGAAAGQKGRDRRGGPGPHPSPANNIVIGTRLTEEQITMLLSFPTFRLAAFCHTLFRFVPRACAVPLFVTPGLPLVQFSLSWTLPLCLRPLFLSDSTHGIRRGASPSPEAAGPASDHARRLFRRMGSGRWAAQR